MNFVVDYNKAEQSGFMPEEGVYEVLIDGAEESRTKSGTEYLKLTLYIRDDVEQNGKGECFDWPVWKLREPKAGDPSGYPQWRIQAISKAVQLPNGQNYDGLQSWMRAIMHKALQVKVEHESFNDRMQARVTTLYESQAPAPPLEKQGMTEVNVEDLPF